MDETFPMMGLWAGGIRIRSREAYRVRLGQFFTLSAPEYLLIKLNSLGLGQGKLTEHPLGHPSHRKLPGIF